MAKDLEVNSPSNSISVYYDSIDVKTVGNLELNLSAGNAIFVQTYTDEATSFSADVGGDLIINGGGWGVRNEGFHTEDGSYSNDGHGTINIKAKNIYINSENGISNNGSGKEIITADNIYIKSSFAFGVISRGAGGIEINTNNNVVISYDGERSDGGAILNRDSGSVTIKSKGNVVVHGNIVNEQDVNENPDSLGAITVSFNGENSSFTGAVKTLGSGTTNLTFTDGALWTATGESQVSTVAMDDGIIDLNGNDVTIAKLDGFGTVLLDVSGEELGSLTVTDEASAASLLVDLGQTSDDVTDEQVKTAMQQISAGEGVEREGYTREGLVAGAKTYDAAGNLKHEVTNTLMRDTLELASAGTLSIQRILMNDVRKRMGDLRSSTADSGVWARYDGGELDSGSGLKNQFNTIQAGADTMLGAVRAGLALSYTQGDTDYARGSGDMDAYGLSAYGVWMADNGFFADVVGRVAKIDHEMKVDGTMKGKQKNTAWSLSGELGWHFQATDLLFVEPQAELTYTYIDSDKISLRGAGNAADYEIDSLESLIGRAGLAAGFKCPNNRGNVYAHVSAVHEFLGDAEISGRAASGLTSAYSIDGKDTWVEYGLGANVNITDSTHMWLDVERTAGARMDEDWRATVGVRYAF